MSIRSLVLIALRIYALYLLLQAVTYLATFLPMILVLDGGARGADVHFVVVAVRGARGNADLLSFSLALCHAPRRLRVKRP